MKKKQILEMLPNLKTMRREAKSKQKALHTISQQVQVLEFQIEQLDGVTLHGEYPIQVIEGDAVEDDVEIWAAGDETSRYAYISRDSDVGVTPERWRATSYRSETSTDGTILGEGLSRSAAIRAGKDFVATGRVQNADKAEDAKQPARKSRGSA